MENDAARKGEKMHSRHALFQSHKDLQPREEGNTTRLFAASTPKFHELFGTLRTANETHQKPLEKHCTFISTQNIKIGNVMMPAPEEHTHCLGRNKIFCGD